MTILKAFSKLSLLSFLILYWGVVSNAQLLEVPLEGNPVILERLELNPAQDRNNQVCPTDTLSLPFFDDFSAKTGSVYPNCSNWQDNHVFINDDMAYKPPSIGVATFEGLKWNGTPYNIGASVSIGCRYLDFSMH